MSYELKDFVRKVIEVRGGVAEPGGEREDVLDVLLPPELQKRLSMKEHEVLVFSSDLPGKFVAYGTPLLDKIISLTEDTGVVTAVTLPDVTAQKTGITRLIDDGFEFINVKKRGYLLGSNVMCSYLLMNFCASIVSDERKEELFSIIIDEQTLRSPQHLSSSLFSSYAYTYREKEPIPLFPRRPLHEIWDRTKSKARVRLKHELEDWEKSHLRRLKRDVERLRNYYEQLKKELRRRMMRQSSSSEENETIMSKLRAVDAEFQRKVEDLKDKYSLRIDVKFLNACRIYVPKIATDCEVQRKSSTRNITFFWNPLLKNVEPIEPLVCEACGEDTYGVFLCDKLHLLCLNCHFSCQRCGKKICKKCFPAHCPSCNTRWISN